MPYLHEFKKEDYPTLLAARKVDGTGGTLFPHTHLMPDPTNRIILIGVGGMGVRTIDRIKGEASQRLYSPWHRYAAFLGIDTSWSEFTQAAFLEPQEQMMLTDPGVNQRMAHPATYPNAVASFMPEGTRLRRMDGDGAGGTRLIGKIKFHDQAIGSRGFDENVVARLQTMVSHDLDPLTSPIGKYEIYVIGSVCGGTGGGMIPELPALIRKAIPSARVHAMLYLPDTMEALDPENASQLKANGYATLKEINYYMGMFMRGRDYPEAWSYNNPAQPRLTCASTLGDEQFIDMPYLIGTTHGPTDRSYEEAICTVSEYCLQQLVKTDSPVGDIPMSTAFAANALAAARINYRVCAPGSNQQEAAHEYHEFPNRYAAMGFAKASVPRKMVRAYIVGEVCQKAGLRPVSREAYNTLAATNTSLLPFRGEDHLQNAREGTAEAKAILEPILNVHRELINNGNFSFAAHIDCHYSWNRIRCGEFGSKAVESRVDAIVAAQTDSKALESMDRALKSAYAAYRNNVMEYVRKYGPYAFVNLYHGRFLAIGEDYGTGIHRMIKNLMEGKTAEGQPYFVRSAQETYARLQEARKTVVNTPLISLKHDRVAAEWVIAYNNWVNARINAARREAALGPVGKLRTVFGEPAEMLAREVEAFGRVLDMLTGIYQNLGAPMQSYAEFRNARDSHAELNLAAVCPEAYAWLKDQADMAVARVNPQSLRDRLVDDFFGCGSDGIANSARWLEVPGNCSRINCLGRVELISEEIAIPARKQFDTIVAEAIPNSMVFSVEELFDQLYAAGQNYTQTAYSVMHALMAQSKPLFNGDIPMHNIQTYVVYPSSLENGNGNGPAIAAAIRNAAGLGAQCYTSDDADCISFYQMAAPMEIYRLCDLKNWEKHYEQSAYCTHGSQIGLHGLAPNTKAVPDADDPNRVHYLETISWKDYPPITGRSYDQLPKALKQTIEQARALGVLYSEHTQSGWAIHRLNMDGWRFDVAKCSNDPVTGLQPTGRALLEEAAAQNGKKLEDVSRTVHLICGGVMDMETTEEDKAWEYAARILHVHVPMYMEVLNAVKLAESWIAEIAESHTTAAQQEEI